MWPKILHPSPIGRPSNQTLKIVNVFTRAIATAEEETYSIFRAVVKKIIEIFQNNLPSLLIALLSTNEQSFIKIGATTRAASRPGAN